MDQLSSLQAFVKTADLGSFVAAGRVLGLSASAVGKSVSRLEQELGARLLQRSTRSLQLTAEGELFHEHCKRILDDLDEARASLAQALAAPRGRLRVSVPLVSYHLLLPLLPAFSERYPDVELDIDFNDRLVDLIDEGIDLAIRSGDLPDSRLVSRPLRHYRLLMCASPQYLEVHGRPQTPRQLQGHLALRFRYPNSGKLLEWPVELSHGLAQTGLRNAMVFNNMEAVRAATLQGLGLGCMPDFLVQEPLREGRLIALLDEDRRPTGQFHAIWPTSRHLSPRLRVFVDHLCKELGPQN